MTTYDVTPYFLSGYKTACGVALLACISACSSAPQPNWDRVTAKPAANIKAMTPNRLIAKLDGLKADDDPRLARLKSKLAELNLEVISFATETAKATAITTLYLVVGVDVTKQSPQQAIAQLRGLETFSYVEIDQAVQKK